jgi:hypothetical protein
VSGSEARFVGLVHVSSAWITVLGPPSQSSVAVVSGALPFLIAAQ